MTAAPVTALPAGLTLQQLQATNDRPDFLKRVLDAEVADGRVRLEDGRYSIVREAFDPDLLAAWLDLLDLTEWVTTATASNGSQPSPEDCDLALAADVAALLAEEPFGVACDTITSRLHRRRADVLSTLKAHTCFVREGRTRGARWRLAPRQSPEGQRDGIGRNLRPSLGQALGHLLLDRQEALEHEVAALRAQLSGQEVPPA